jgi:hypothetical protein
LIVFIASTFDAQPISQTNVIRMFGAKQNIKFPSEHFEIPKTRKNWNSFAFFLVNPCQSLSYKNQHLLNNYKFHEKKRKDKNIGKASTNQCHSMPRLYNMTTQIKLKLHYTFLEEKTLKQQNF